MRRKKIIGIVSLAVGAVIWAGSNFDVLIVSDTINSLLGNNKGSIQKIEKVTRKIKDSDIIDLVNRATGANISCSELDDINKALGIAKDAANEVEYNELQNKLKNISKEDLLKLLNNGINVPAYDGKYEVVLGKSDFKVLPSKTKYYELDSYGRPTGAEAVITVKSFPKESRKERPIDINPVGWTKNFKVSIKHKDGSTYKGYFWNRSHIIADSFGGEVRIENLTTGTRAQNVGSRDNNGGMAYGESIVRNYLKSHKNGKVYYRVKVHYNDDKDLISDYSEVNIKSADGIEDHKIIVYNEMADYKIDRKTGKVN